MEMAPSCSIIASNNFTASNMEKYLKKINALIRFCNVKKKTKMTGQYVRQFVVATKMV